MIQLFKALRSTILNALLYAHLVERVIKTTARLASRSGISMSGEPADMVMLMKEISHFCGTFLSRRNSPSVLVSTAMLTLTMIENLQQYYGYITLQNTEWIFTALEHVQRMCEENPNMDAKEWDNTTNLKVQSLLHFLIPAVSSSPPLQSSLKSLHIILQALSASGDISLMAFLALCSHPSWFLHPILHNSSVWSQLGHVALKYPHFAFHYHQLGNNILNKPEWKQIISADLPTWITTFIIGGLYPKTDSNFISVIRSVWVPDFHDPDKVIDERNESWILALLALSKCWEAFEFTTASHDSVLLGRCTVSMALRLNYFPRAYENPIPRNIRASFFPNLSKSVTQAATNARNAVPTESDGPYHVTPTLGRVSNFLEVLGEKLRTEFEPTQGEVQLRGVTKYYGNWTELEEHFAAELDVLEELIGAEREGLNDCTHSHTKLRILTISI
ncbi:hypothetical protein B0H19DRAFT_1226933 [Mycena capillaripes]|nr:hypothetical protein B0H19DRAFT_1226933 [Mycena capillaripes]